MQMNDENDVNPSECTPRFWALIPFLIFLIFYLGLSVWAHDFYKVPMPVAFLVASASAFFLSRRHKLSMKVELYAKGMGEPNIMIMCLIFILAGTFATVAKGMGAVDAAVLITRRFIPANFLLAGIFLVSSLISLAIGTSCGTIAALTPIAAGLVAPLGIAPEIMIGAVVGGSMFGDNMSMISDTTIAATRTQNVLMRDKFLANLRMVLPAAILTLIVYLFIRPGNPAEADPLKVAVGWKHLVLVLPYILILILALCSLNVMFLLFFGTVLACMIGILLGSFDFWKALGLCGQGTLGMSETLIVAILAGGLLYIIKWNGGISYLIKKIENHIRSSRGCELGVFLLVATVNLFTANNTVAIVIAGPIAHELSLKFNCDPKRIASILDTTSCFVQGIIPYGAQVLIAVGVASNAGLEIPTLKLLGSLFYPWVMAIFLLLTIFLTRHGTVPVRK